jgi:putative transcriptional regulator
MQSISDIRIEKSISQKALAKELEISYWYLNKVEKGKVRLTPKLAARIARSLDVSLIELLNQKDRH